MSPSRYSTSHDITLPDLGTPEKREKKENTRPCVRMAAPLTPHGQITRFSRTIFPQHVRQIRKHDVSPVGRRQGGEPGERGWTVRGGLLLSGNDETDGLLCLLVSDVRRLPTEARDTSIPQERGDRISQDRGSLMKCRHYRCRTKPTFAPADVPRATLLPANTRFLKSHCWTRSCTRCQDLNELTG